MDNWPTSLGDPLVGVRYTPIEGGTIRTQMDAGIAKVRRRWTDVPCDVSMRLLCNRSQVQTLDDFVAITLSDVLPFQWRDWRKPAGAENVVVYRFKRRPSYEDAGAPGLWYATLDLEMLTTFQGTFLLDVAPLST